MLNTRNFFCIEQKILQLYRQRHFWKNMNCAALTPPAAVRGMRELQREAFDRKVQIPQLRVPEAKLHKVLPLVKQMLLKMEKFQPVRVVTEGEKQILLHPAAVAAWEALPTSELQKLEVDAQNFCFSEFTLGYANWRADEIFKSVLPTEDEGLTSYSRIGHIVHLNLREHLLPYKALIGQVLCDKVAGCRTVVNKAASIDNTYRNFQLELICGTPEYLVETKENGITFEFDFANVYWNPRLCTEHERIVKELRSGDVLYDVFAGVGPFSVPAAKKGCTVLANDLNPESFKWLQHNAKRNKCQQRMQLFNKDGRDFILQDIKADLLQRWSAKHVEETAAYTMHITMNLPAMAVEFLNAFRGLLAQESSQLSFDAPHFNYPVVHVYSFAKGEHTKQLVRALVEQHLGLPLADNLLGIHFVRNVAPNKDMYRVSFRLTAEILCTEKNVHTNAAERKRAASRELSKEEQNESTAHAQSAKIKCL